LQKRPIILRSLLIVATPYQDRGKNRTKQSGKAGGGSRGGKLRHSRDLYITRMDESRSCVTKRGKARGRRGGQTCETLD